MHIATAVTVMSTDFSAENISATADVLMLLVAIVSAFYAYRAYAHQRDRSKKSAACDLAAHFANVIIKKHALVSSVFAQAGLDKYIKDHIDVKDICDFDRDELAGLLSRKEIDCKTFINKIYAVEPLIILNCKIAQTCSTVERERTLADYTVVDNETGERKLQDGSFLIRDFFQEITDLLNQLEWFAMNFQYGLADEELLYQSLHQTYLSLVWMLYPIISYNNTSNENKLYTNVIWLFEEWQKRLKEITRVAEQLKREHEEKAEAEKAKAATIKPKVHKGRGLK